MHRPEWPLRRRKSRSAGEAQCPTENSTTPGNPSKTTPEKTVHCPCVLDEPPKETSDVTKIELTQRSTNDLPPHPHRIWPPRDAGGP